MNAEPLQAILRQTKYLIKDELLWADPNWTEFVYLIWG